MEPVVRVSLEDSIRWDIRQEISVTIGMMTTSGHRKFMLIYILTIEPDEVIFLTLRNSSGPA